MNSKNIRRRSFHQEHTALSRNGGGSISLTRSPARVLCVPRLLVPPPYVTSTTLGLFFDPITLVEVAVVWGIASIGFTKAFEAQADLFVPLQVTENGNDGDRPAEEEKRRSEKVMDETDVKEEDSELPESKIEKKWESDGASAINEKTVTEVRDSEDAVFDARDFPSSGVEADTMERSVMMESDTEPKIKEKAEHPERKETYQWEEDHLIHGAKAIHEETEAELQESEEAALFDAHDCDDPGVEAAMMERAVMMVSKMAHKMKEEAEHREKHE